MLGPLPLERVAWLTPLKHGATCVTIPNFVALDQTSWAYIGGPQFFWTLGPYLLGWGVADPLKHATAHVLQYQILSLWVKLY